MDKRMVELFAGVGGFRLGFDRLKSGWDTVWFSQWEPGAKKQWAHDCYVSHFGDCKDLKGEYHTGEDISTVDKNSIPDHTLLVGGFPCQDYSIMNRGREGMVGKKGVLWWQIYAILEAKKPAFCMFENVGPLLSMPVNQKGRDFATLLWCLNNLGYSAEWRLINAAEYGGCQKRRRVFIFVWRNDTNYGGSVKPVAFTDAFGLLTQDCLMQKAFPGDLSGMIYTGELPADVNDLQDSFSFDFRSSGVMVDGLFHTVDVDSFGDIPCGTLGSVLETGVAEEFFIDEPLKIDKLRYFKSAKTVERKAKYGPNETYLFSEGNIPFPDRLDAPSRTMITSEGTFSRESHIVLDPENSRYRFITPIEAERLQGFDDDWTHYAVGGVEVPKRMRYFFMGNSLVVPMITRMGKVLDEIISHEA